MDQVVRVLVIGEALKAISYMYWLDSQELVVNEPRLGRLYKRDESACFERAYHPVGSVGGCSDRSLRSAYSCRPH